MTTGTPIALMIDNVDQRSKDYGDIADRFRPGHADYTYWPKYGIRDYRGGGRSSARETAMRVAAGAVARKVLGAGRAHPRRAGADRPARDRPRALGLGGRSEQNPFFCPDPVAAARWDDYLDEVRKAGSSAGAVIEVVAEGVPPGLGAPVYDKLDADLAGALMRINAVKGVEIGAGLRRRRADGRGERRRDARCRTARSRSPRTTPAASSAASRPARPIVARFAVKPTSSILTPRAAGRPPGQRGRDRRPRAATTPASASARCRSARR